MHKNAKAYFSSVKFIIKQRRAQRKMLKRWRKKDRIIAKALLGIN